MDFVEDIFERMNLQQICSFILNRVENFEIESCTYEESIKEWK